MRITVLGCGTSGGVPALGCDCEVCRSTDPRNNRTRASVYVAKGDARLLVDCGPDFRQQALRENIRRVDGLFITHIHADHIHGIDDLRAINWLQRKPIPVFSTPETLASLGQIYDYCFNPPQRGGGVPKLEFVPVEGGRTFEFMGVSVTPIPAWHGKLEVLGFRFDDFVYLTDCSSIPESSRPLIEGVETLVLSALRPKPHETHFSISEAVEESRRYRPRRTYLIHMTHDVDYAAISRSLPAGCELLYDGLQFEVSNHCGADRRVQA